MSWQESADDGKDEEAGADEKAVADEGASGTGDDALDDAFEDVGVVSRGRENELALFFDLDLIDRGMIQICS